MINYTELSVEEFNEHCQALYAEQERRSKLNSIPNEIKTLADNFEQLGGNRVELIAKIEAEKPPFEAENPPAVEEQEPVVEEK